MTYTFANKLTQLFNQLFNLIICSGDQKLVMMSV